MGNANFLLNIMIKLRRPKCNKCGRRIDGEKLPNGRIFYHGFYCAKCKKHFCRQCNVDLGFPADCIWCNGEWDHMRSYVARFER